MRQANPSYAPPWSTEAQLFKIRDQLARMYNETSRELADKRALLEGKKHVHLETQKSNHAA